MNNEDLKAKLGRLLLDKSYIPGEVTLTSGKKSSYYFDCKQTALHPEGAYLLGKSFFYLLAPGIAGIGGPTLGADPLVCSVSLISYLEGRPLPAFIVRKEPKSHGTGQYLEGLKNFRQGQKVALIEDVVTSGGSLLKACQRTQAAGLEVGQVLCILDREEGGAQRLQEHGYSLTSIFTISDLLKDK